MNESNNTIKTMLPEPSDWECELFGAGSMILLRPSKGDVPNIFWRWMQFLILGNKWKRLTKK